MNAAIEYYGLQNKKQVNRERWPVLKHYSQRVGKSAHAKGWAAYIRAC